jgi:uncharacterized protein
VELFAIPHDDKYILYAPLNQIAILVSPGVVDLLSKFHGEFSSKSECSSKALTPEEESILKTLTQLGFLRDSRLTPRCEIQSEFSPTFVTLFLTTRCNLRCTYCYAVGGERTIGTLRHRIARAAIDLVISNTLRRKQKQFGIAFHGGGEPTLAWAVLKASVLYAKERAAEMGLSVNFMIASNGVLPEHKLEWIMTNFQGISLSLDGPDDIQNAQRPMKNGRGSCTQVMRTVKRLNQRNFPFSVRVTVTDQSVSHLARIVTFLAQECRARRIHLEPAFVCGRCCHSGASSPSDADFINQFREAQVAADRLGVPLFYSGARLENITTAFCKAAGESFCITTDGYVTSCYEVCSREDPRSNVFFYGQWHADHRVFIIDNDKLARLKSRTVDNIEFCKDCFCKYHCAGDCLVKASDSRTLQSITNPFRCKINQELTKDQILKLLSKDN